MTREMLTHTKRRDFLNCPRYFFHRHEQGLELVAKKTGRRRGTIFGDAIQAARDWQEIDDTWDEIDTDRPGVDEYLQFGSSIEAALDGIDTHYVAAISQAGSQEQLDELEIERVKMRVMVRAYIDRYGLVPRREVEFYLPLVNPATGGRSRTFDRAGKLDGLQVLAAKRGRVIEDKLVQQIQKAMIERLPLDAQASEYVDALLSKGWTAEVAYRHTRWPGINPTKEKIPPELTPGGKPSKAKYVPPESLDEFELRLEQDVIDRRDTYFDEQRLVFPQVHMDDYRAGRYGVARMIMDARVRQHSDGFQSAFPMNPSRCWEYGGCEFIPLCTKQEGAIDRYQVVADNQELSINAADAEAEGEA